MGDKKKSYEIKLATPVLLTSKVVVYNLLSNRPEKESILSALQILVNAANALAQRSFKSNAFGHLHVVLRGCLGTDDEAQGIIFGKEDEDNLPDDAADDDVEAMGRRNKIRSAIKLAFESVKVWSLPELAKGTSGPVFNYEYTQKVEAMKRDMHVQLAEPKYFANRALTGDALALLMPNLAAALDTDDPALNPPSIMDAVNMKQAEVVMMDICDGASDQFESIAMPQPEEVIGTELTGMLDGLLDQFNRYCAEKSIPEAIATEVRAHLHNSLLNTTNGIAERNAALLTQFEQDFKAAVEPIYEDATQQIKNIKLGQDAATFAEATGKIEKKFARQVEALMSEHTRPTWDPQEATEELRAQLQAGLKARSSRQEAKNNEQLAVKARQAAEERAAQQERRRQEAEARAKQQELRRQEAERQAREERQRQEEEHRRLLKAEQEKTRLAEERAREARRQAAASASYSYGGGGYGGGGGGGSGGGGGGGKFYKGGQFTPGGGRAPKGGGYF